MLGILVWIQAPGRPCRDTDSPNFKCKLMHSNSDSDILWLYFRLATTRQKGTFPIYRPYLWPLQNGLHFFIPVWWTTARWTVINGTTSKNEKWLLYRHPSQQTDRMHTSGLSRFKDKRTTASSAFCSNDIRITVVYDYFIFIKNDNNRYTSTYIRYQPQCFHYVLNC